MAPEAKPAPKKGLVHRIPFYYGWVMVGTLAVFNGLAAPIAGTRLGLFVKPMGEDLGWSAAVFGWAQLAGTLTVIVSAPFIGQFVDRYGARLLVPLVSLLGGAAVASLAFVAAPWQLIVVFGLTGLVGLGRAADLYGNVVISKWFVRRRGRAIGIAFAASTMGLVVFMPVTQWLIGSVGWSSTWLIFGLGAPVIVVPLTVLLLRREPEDVGLLPDGAVLEPPDEERAVGLRRALPLEQSFTRLEAFRTPTFWLMVVGFGIATFSTSMQSVFRVPHFIERGLSPQLVAFAVSADAIGAALVGLLVGRLVERFPARYVVLAGFALMAGAALISVIGDTVVELFLAFLCFGTAMGFIMVSQSVMWANSFGRAHLGSIRGIAVPIILMVSATAFPLTGYIRDVVGEYTPAWWISAAGMVVAGFFVSQARPPRLKTRNEAPAAPQRGGAA